jgi:hypothetical protein
MIDRAEDGTIYFEGGIGPVPVARQAAALATPCWRVTIVLAEQAGGWEIAEVGNVYPRLGGCRGSGACQQRGHSRCAGQRGGTGWGRLAIVPEADRAGAGPP